LNIDFSIFTQKIFSVKKYQLLFLAVLSGLLLGFAWFPHGILPLLFVGFVPLLLIENEIFLNPVKYKSRSVFFYGFISFFIWNILTTWWIMNASVGGAIMAFFVSTLFMTIAFYLFHRIKKQIGSKFGNVIFICCWITFEILFYNDQITFPWLSLGNAFADNPGLIQWYEYTGVFGGSLWVLIINCFFFSLITLVDSKFRFHINKLKTILLIAIIAIPILLSFIVAARFKMHSRDGFKKIKVVIVQPNIDPYNEKFSGSYEQQLHKMLLLASQKVDSATEYMVLPETALTEDIWEGEMEQSSSIKSIREYLKQFPKLKIIIGASTNKLFSPWEKLSATARKFTQEDAYYDSYNTALQIDSSDKTQVYHKSKLVPGVEQMPFQFIFKYFDQLTIELGGTTGSLGTQDERSVFTSPKNSFKVAPVICYESVYGEYVTKYVQNGAQCIAIITNDGWWGNTAGYKQHLKYGALRAIENRRWIVRSANTGTSCFVSPLGEIEQATNWWVPTAISGNIELNEGLTFYSCFGDYLGRFAECGTILLLLYSWLIRFKIVKK